MHGARLTRIDTDINFNEDQSTRSLLGAVVQRQKKTLNHLAFMNTIILTLGLTLLLLPMRLQAEFVTLSAGRAASNGVAQITIAASQLAEVVSFPASVNSAAGISLAITKDGWTHRYYPTLSPSGVNSVPAGFFDPCVVAGPATLSMVSVNGNPGFCTVKITPESFPPDKTIIVLPGTGGGNITMECSTNLIQWTPASNGVYTNLSEARFFRIRLDRIP